MENISGLKKFSLMLIFISLLPLIVNYANADIQQFDAIIYTPDSIHLYAQYSPELNLTTNISTDFTSLMNQVQNKLPSGSSIKIKSGVFGMNSDLTLYKSYNIWCNKISPLSLSPSQGTRIYTNNYTIIQTQEYSETHDCFFDGVVNHHKDVYDIKASGIRNYDIVVKGSNDNIPVHFLGNSTYNVGNNIFSGLILNGSPSMMFDGYSSQNDFPYLQIQSFTKNALIFHNADNNIFKHLEIAVQSDSGGSAIVIGKNGTDQSYSEHFDYLSVTCNNCNTVQVNTNPKIGFDQSIILDTGNSSPLISYTNNGYGNLIWYSDTPYNKYFNIITPQIPQLGVQIQNNNSNPIIIYQNGGKNVLITDLTGPQRNIGNQTMIELDPGFKIGFALSNPTSWTWEAR